MIIHSDADNYFAAVEEKFNPKLRNIPFAVCGDPEMRHSIVMSKNACAKKYGIPTGISFRQARMICPELEYVKADYNKYLGQTKLMRSVYKKYTDKVIPYGMDESWLDLGNVSFDEAKQIAELIRVEIFYGLGLSASLGVSYNLIFSKIGSDYNKPNGITLITQDNYKSIVWPMPASALLFIGAKRAKQLSRIGIFTIGDIALSNQDKLVKLLGKVGYDIWLFANGDDQNFKPNADYIGSIGNTITPPADLMNNDDVSAVLYLLASTICTRLKKHNLRAGNLSISIRDNSFNKIIRQSTFKNNTDNVNCVFNQAWKLFVNNYKWERVIRSVGITVGNLTSVEQLVLFPYEEKLVIDVDNRIKRLTKRLGELKVEGGGGVKCAGDIVF